ncbi:14394_t:CDS:2 [Ambispora leptoticha]|uniref:14394_t:CDS:1 n=1 Tax=Ambispora leptoticha TaxID=144679 RepID=A0A9N8ZN70_9GLOM|nr:14394_t:CDS:2 [Ambispora leptoticha]
MNKFRSTLLFALFVYAVLSVALYETANALAIKRQTPNCGELKITSPKAGQTCKKGDEITVEVSCGSSGVTKIASLDIYSPKGAIKFAWSGSLPCTGGKASQKLKLDIPDGADVKYGTGSDATGFMIRAWGAVGDNGPHCTAMSDQFHIDDTKTSSKKKKNS